MRAVRALALLLMLVAAQVLQPINPTLLAQEPVIVVNAASRTGPTVAPESIALALGEGLATSSEEAPELPLPLTLAGRSITVTDSTGSATLAGLFSVSPDRIEFLVPFATSIGQALITISGTEGVVAIGLVEIEPVAPGLFSADGTGQGVAEATIRRVRADGTESTEDVFQCSTSTSCVSVPIQLGPETDQVFLRLLGTGIRGFQESIRATVGGEAAAAFGGNAHAQLPGRDHVEVLLPRSLIGRGDVDVLVWVDGKVANTVTVSIGSGTDPVPVDCPFSLSHASASFSADGGSGRIGVGAADDCAWTANSSETWIAITSGQQGMGNGLVEYSVLRNTDSQRSGTITIAGQVFSVVQSSPLPVVPLEGIVNAASFSLGLVPGSLVSIFGTGLSEGITGTVLPGGETSFRGTSVWIGGWLAPLLSITNQNGMEQINLQAPFELLSGTTTTVEVDNNGRRAVIGGIPVLLAQPGIFEIPIAPEGTRLGAVIHLNGELVTPSNPARRSEIVSMFLTGAGPISPLVATGELGPIPAPTTTLPVIVGVASMGMRVLFSGYAPGFMGLYQINFEISPDVPSGPFVKLNVKVGGAFSQDTSIAVE